MANVTGKPDVISNPEGTSLRGIIVFLSTLNIFLSITASLSNVMILIALRKVSSVHPPTKLFFRYLAVTDLCTGFIAQPLLAIHMLLPVIGVDWNTLIYIGRAENASGFILCSVSILTSTAISVDRLLALLLKMRYRHVVTLRRVRTVMTCFWLIGGSCGFLSFFGRFIALYAAGSGLLILFVVISVFAYTKIFFTLRQRQAQVQAHGRQGQPNGVRIPLNIAKYKKTVSSIAWVQVALLVCYVPFAIVGLSAIYGRTTFFTWNCTATLLYLNSSLNPVLYCWKMKEVRQAVKDTVRQFYFV